MNHSKKNENLEPLPDMAELAPDQDETQSSPELETETLFEQEDTCSDTPDSPPNDITILTNGEKSEDNNSIEPSPLTPNPLDKITTQLNLLNSEIGKIALSVDAIDSKIEQLENLSSSIDSKLSFIPPQIRTFANKLDAVITAVGEARYRALLLDVIRIYDLVNQLLLLIPDENASKNSTDRHNYKLLQTQIKQLIEENGVYQIPAEGEFNPNFHRAIKQTPVTDPDQDKQIIEVIRPGFKSDQIIIRYAEVIVGKYTPPESPQTDPNKLEIENDAIN